MAQLINAVISGNLTLTGKLNGYNIGSAIEKGVDTSIAANSTNIPTSAAIVNYVTTAINNWKTANTFSSVTTATNSSDNQVTDVVVPNGYTAGFHQALPKGWATTSATANITASGLGVSWSNDAFKISGTLTASGTATAAITPGYIRTGNKTENSITTGTITWTGNTVDTVGTDLDFDSTVNTILKPTIKDAVSSLSGKTRIEISPTTNSSNINNTIKYYISVDSSANTVSLPATSKVSSPGFGNTVHFNAQTRYKTVGAAETDITYLPLPTASASLSFSGVPAVTLSNNSGLTIAGRELISFTPRGNSSNWGSDYNHFYLGISAGYANQNVNITPTLNSPGYIGNANELPATISLSQSSTPYYAPLKTGLLGICSKADGETGGTYASYPEYNSTNFPYVSNIASILTEGYLIINEGYYKNSKISLGQLIGDIDPNDEVLISGSIPKIVPSSTYYTSSNTGFGQLTAHSFINSSSDLYIKAGSFGGAFTTTSTAGSNLQLVSTSGWIDSIYLQKITLQNSKQIQIDDGIATWTISKDSSGNVTIS